MKGRELVLENLSLELRICAGERSVTVHFRDKESGRVLAHGPYMYRLEEELEEGRLLVESPVIEKATMEGGHGGKMVARLSGKVGKLNMVHQFTLYPEKASIDEAFVLSNQGNSTIHIGSLRFGFTRLLTDDVGGVLTELGEDRFVPVPFMRPILGRNGEYDTYSVSDLLFKRGYYRDIQTSFREEAVLPAESFGAEGWVWTFGERSLLITSYCQDHMEYSLMGTGRCNEGVRLCFGGCGIWHQDPECLASIGPAEKVICGNNRYQLINGGFKEGYYAFRDFMDEHKHAVPEGFDPPVHWNELFDNRLWHVQPYTEGYYDKPENRKTYCRREDLEKEAVKAQEIGCQSLYLDPGWDTNFGSSIWDDKRLGSLERFVQLMHSKYSLAVALHCPVAGWCNPSSYSKRACRMDVEGNHLTGQLCSGASEYLNEKADRLLKLCEAGVRFIMFDGTVYTGPCFDRDHGHPVPYTREAHCRSYLELTRRVHEKFPRVIIEMHDMLVGGYYNRYCPIYYLHGLPLSFDENWAFEYMWLPLEDLLCGRSISLYYYNLAYSLPLYIHIDLRTDNRHGLAFWWYASTCRHLGIGGKHFDPNVWEVHKAAMQQYLGLKEFYTQGAFYGFGEDFHVHALPNRGAAVVNLFNLSEHEVMWKGSFSLEEIGLSADRLFIIQDHSVVLKGPLVEINRRMAPHSAAVVEIWPAKNDK